MEEKVKKKRGPKPKSNIKRMYIRKPEDLRTFNNCGNEPGSSTSFSDVLPSTSHVQEYCDFKNGTGDKKEDSQPCIDWPEKDLTELFRKMELALPERDTLAFSTRVEKLDWNEIAFKSYTGEDCKRTWMLVQKRLRRFRILGELLSDAKEWMSKPWTNFYRGGKTKRHPEMPRRPLSTYMLFYLKKKDKILEENPGIDMTEVSKKIAVMYKSISPEHREKYTHLAAEERKEYEEKLMEFHRKYPDISTAVEKTSGRLSEKRPKKPLTPFGLYYKEQLRQFVNNPGVDRNAIKEKCKEQWKNMSDKKKVVWIDWALEEETKYQEAMKNYMSHHNSDYVPTPSKTLLTKEEKIIKQRVMGKPIKPPNSAYSLFSTMMLQSESIKSVCPKSRMNVIATKWKLCSDDEKKQFKEKAVHLMDQYKLDFATYLESLPEDVRQEELRNNLPKRKIKPTCEADDGKRRKVDPSEVKKEETVTSATLFEGEPKQPPVSAFAYFAGTYVGGEPTSAAWKAVPHEQKKKIDAKVTQMKQAYLKDYEKFLKSLTKKQLTAYSQFKKSKAVKIEEPDGCDDECSESEDEDESTSSGSECSA